MPCSYYNLNGMVLVYHQSPLHVECVSKLTLIIGRIDSFVFTRIYDTRDIASFLIHGHLCQ